MFLEPKGRILFDCLITKAEEFNESDPMFLIDVHLSDANLLSETLKKYSFRKKVKFDSSNHQIASLYSPNFVPAGDLGAPYNPYQIKNNKILSFIDPRTQNLGLRILTKTEFEEINDVEYSNEEQFKAFRILCGVSEGPCIRLNIPHHLNFQYLNSISLNKGCYVGQELIARTSSQGVVRTGLFPFYVGEKKIESNRFEVVDESLSLGLGMKIIGSDGSVVGDVIEHAFNVGLGKMKIDKVKENCCLENGQKINFLEPVYCIDRIDP